MLRNLSIRDFRCFARFELEFDPEITCIVGANALGKTSLLEAVVVLTRLQSPRTNSLAPVIRTGAKGLVVDGMVDDRHMQFYYSPKRRKLALDSVEQKDAYEYLQVARLVFFANTDIDLVRGTGEERRRFLDFLGSHLLKMGSSASWSSDDGRFNYHPVNILNAGGVLTERVDQTDLYQRLRNVQGRQLGVEGGDPQSFGLLDLSHVDDGQRAAGQHRRRQLPHGRQVRGDRARRRRQREGRTGADGGRAARQRSEQPPVGPGDE